MDNDIKRVAYAGVVTEEDIKKAKINGALPLDFLDFVKDKKVGTAWIIIRYFKDNNYYGEIDVDNNGHLDKQDMSEVEDIPEDFEDEIEYDPHVYEVISSDFEKIDKTNPWKSIKRLMTEYNIPVKFKEDLEYENENESEIDLGFGPRR